jgi:hypothetical protein
LIALWTARSCIPYQRVEASCNSAELAQTLVLERNDTSTGAGGYADVGAYYSPSGENAPAQTYLALYDRSPPVGHVAWYRVCSIANDLVSGAPLAKQCTAPVKLTVPVGQACGPTRPPRPHTCGVAPLPRCHSADPRFPPSP